LINKLDDSGGVKKFKQYHYDHFDKFQKYATVKGKQVGVMRSGPHS
jgi:predicted metallo-beta-lactamase superfamily hydrolase